METSPDLSLKTVDWLPKGFLEGVCRLALDEGEVVVPGRSAKIPAIEAILAPLVTELLKELASINIAEPGATEHLTKCMVKVLRLVSDPTICIFTANSRAFLLAPDSRPCQEDGKVSEGRREGGVCWVPVDILLQTFMGAVVQSRTLLGCCLSFGLCHPRMLGLPMLREFPRTKEVEDQVMALSRWEKGPHDLVFQIARLFLKHAPERFFTFVSAALLVSRHRTQLGAEQRRAPHFTHGECIQCSAVRFVPVDVH
jgi:hypothetical protein